MPQRPPGFDGFAQKGQKGGGFLRRFAGHMLTDGQVRCPGSGTARTKEWSIPSEAHHCSLGDWSTVFDEYHNALSTAVLRATSPDHFFTSLQFLLHYTRSGVRFRPWGLNAARVLTCSWCPLTVCSAVLPQSVLLTLSDFNLWYVTVYHCLMCEF
uniref:(northern house mosquito) hypothetical protein n=1 Tax=Culex pipiens TaxID=7175 RepID=A0A8D8F9N1_CULPI